MRRAAGSVTGNLYIAARAPRPGCTKTRLGNAIGHENAVTLYKAFLIDLADRFTDAPFELGWYVTPDDAWPELSPLVGREGVSARVSTQTGASWTERQDGLFKEAHARGEERTVLIASDSPHLAVEVVEAAFQKLYHHEIVFGPTHDGGYYLIGMRGYHDILVDVTMSTGRELHDIIARATAFSLSVGEVETTFDIDEVQDLQHLREVLAVRDDLNATYAALLELGLGSDDRAVRNQTSNDLSAGRAARG